jgi:hypothetical protein
MPFSLVFPHNGIRQEFQNEKVFTPRPFAWNDTGLPDGSTHSKAGDFHSGRPDGSGARYGYRSQC